MNEKNHNKAVEVILDLQDRIDEQDIEYMKRVQLENVIQDCKKIYILIEPDMDELAKINNYRDKNNIKGEKLVIKVDFLLDTFFQAYESLANLKYPATHDEPNIVPKGTKEREYINKAINNLEELTEYFPEDIDSLFNLGTLYCRVEHYGKAIEPLEKAYRLDPAEDIQKNLNYAKKEFQKEVQDNKLMNKFRSGHISKEYKGWC